MSFGAFLIFRFGSVRRDYSLRKLFSIMSTRTRPQYCYAIRLPSRREPALSVTYGATSPEVRGQEPHRRSHYAIPRESLDFLLPYMI